MRKKVLSLVAVLGLFTMVVAPMVAPRAEADVLTDVSVALTSEVASESDNVVITFTPVTAVTTGSTIEVTYDTAFTGGAALTNDDIDVTGTNITGSTESDFAAGYFKSTVTSSDSVTTEITITIDGTHELTNPGTVGNYNFSVATSVGDSGAGLAYVGDDNDVEVTAIVAPVIDMELFQTGTDDKLTGGSSVENLCALGVLSVNAVKTCSYDIATATNNANGLMVKVNSDDQLNLNATPAVDIDDTSGVVAAGTEAYGFVISNNGGSAYSEQGSYGTADQPVPGSETNFASTSANHDYMQTDGSDIDSRMEVTHSASVDASTQTGSYTQIVTYTAYTK